ncbi:hypothetical protein [Brassicibacter mesophilus]|uniref:hypothetical protein n=1 Tax=Brassicibacter mesophilus TaxID=745119 RepID=UPI003D215265
MKRQNKKEIYLILILIPIFLWLSLNFTTDSHKIQKPYSILNKGKIGTSVFYETLKKLDYPVKLVVSDIKQQKNSVQIVALSSSTSKLDINDDQIKEWIENGGKLIYLTDRLWEDILDYGNKIDTYSINANTLGIVYSYGSGTIILGSTELIENKALTKDTEGAYWLLCQIDKLRYEHIAFNEYYQYSGNEKPSLWRDTPNGIKAILFQLLIFGFIIIYYKGKRFGKPKPLYEEVERTENEFVYAVAALYKKGQCREIVLQSFYEELLIKAKGYFGKDVDIVRENLVELWENEKLPELSKVKKVYDFIGYEMNKGKKINSKKMLEMILIIEHLNRILERRRESRWKTLKKDTQRA